jgi:hypothetical protein
MGLFARRSRKERRIILLKMDTAILKKYQRALRNLWDKFFSRGLRRAR